MAFRVSSLLVLVLCSFSHAVATVSSEGFIIETLSATYQYDGGVRDREASLPAFEVGKFNVDVSQINPSTSDELSPPKPILIASPTEAGKYPVMIFFHGFVINTSYYSNIYKHVASHGYIVVAPQLYTPLKLSSPRRTIPSDDLESVASVITWLPKGLQSALPQDVQSNLDKFVLSGHSRGGEDAFAVALGRIQTSLKFSAVIGVDPVARTIKPPILTNKPYSFKFSAPVLVVGCGSGNQIPLVGPVCAPNEINHKEFFNECRSPSYHFVAKDYAHLDMLDDDISIGTEAFTLLCGKVINKKPLRKFVGGIIVAFLDAYLEGENGDLNAIFQNPELAPANLYQPQKKGLN